MSRRAGGHLVQGLLALKEVSKAAEPLDGSKFPVNVSMAARSKWVRVT